MANVSIKFNNKEFLLACEDGQEEHLEELLIQINKKFNNLLYLNSRAFRYFSLKTFDKGTKIK